MDIYALLKEDHQKVKKLLTSLTSKRDVRTVKELEKEVYVHSEAEEKAFYKPLREAADKLKIIIEVGHNEHDAVSQMIEQLLKIKSPAEWNLLFTTIKKNLEAHISMEEDVIFAIGKKCLSKAQAVAAAQQMREEKEKFEKKLALGRKLKSLIS